MRAVVQRVRSSSVKISNKDISSINRGLNVLLGISKEDSEADVSYLVDKIINLRIFEDENGKMNLSLLDVKGEILVISQFTLYGDCRRGKRPSFIEAQSGDMAIELYELFVNKCKELVHEVKTGCFGEDMLVSIDNDGPVTLLLDSQKTF